MLSGSNFLARFCHSNYVGFFSYNIVVKELSERLKYSKDNTIRGKVVGRPAFGKFL